MPALLSTFRGAVRSLFLPNRAIFPRDESSAPKIKVCCEYDQLILFYSHASGNNNTDMPTVPTKTDDHKTGHLSNLHRDVLSKVQIQLQPCIKFCLCKPPYPCTNGCGNLHYLAVSQVPDILRNAGVESDMPYK